MTKIDEALDITFPNRLWGDVGKYNDPTRRAQSFTPDNDMTLRHFYILAARIPAYPSTPSAHRDTEFTDIAWRIRTDGGGLPGTPLAAGTFSFKAKDAWGTNRAFWYGVHLDSALDLTGGTTYWVTIATDNDETDGTHGLRWFCVETDDATEESAYYDGTNWVDDDLIDHTLLYTESQQAGVEWQVVVNGKGYMTHDEFASYHRRMAQSGLINMRGGQTEESRLVFPYTNASQGSWRNGQGQLNFDDVDAYRGGLQVNTLNEGQILLAPKQVMTTVDHGEPEYKPDSVALKSLPDPNTRDETQSPPYSLYWAQSFTPDSNMYVNSIGIMVRCMAHVDDSTYDFSLSLCNDDGSGNCGTVIQESVIPQLGETNAQITHRLRWVIRDFGNRALNGGMTYWIRLRTTRQDGISDYQFATDGAGNYAGEKMQYSYAGSTWHDHTGDSLVFEINADEDSHKLDGPIADFTEYNSWLFCVAGSKVYRWNEATEVWEDYSAGLVRDGNALVAFNQHLFVSQGPIWGDYPMRYWDGATWDYVGEHTFTDGVLSGVADTSLTSASALFVTNGYQAGDEISIAESGYSGNGTFTIASVDSETQVTFTQAPGAAGTNLDCIHEAHFATKMHVANGFLWITPGDNTIEYTNSGLPAGSWTTDLDVGTSSSLITDITDYAGRILAMKEDSIYERDDNDNFHRYIPYDGLKDDENGISPAHYAGYLFYPVGYSLMRWTGSMYDDVGPALSTGYWRKFRGKVSAMTSGGDFLFAAVSAQSSDTWSQIMAYNGIGWCSLALLTKAGTDYECNAVHFESETSDTHNRLWYADGNKAEYIEFPKDNANPWNTNAEYTSTGGWLFTSWWDGGARDAIKWFNRVRLTVDLPSDDTYVEVYYMLNGQEDFDSLDDFFYLGTITHADSDGILAFPDGVSGKSIQLIFHLVSSDSGESPRIRSWNLESLTRPVPVFYHTLRIDASDNVDKLDGTASTDRSGEDVINEWTRFARSEYPLLVSLPNQTFRGFVTMMDVVTKNFRWRGDDNEWEKVINVTLVEAL